MTTHANGSMQSPIIHFSQRWLAGQNEAPTHHELKCVWRNIYSMLISSFTHTYFPENYYVFRFNPISQILV